MGCNTEVKRHSLLHENPKLSEAFSPRTSRSLKTREKDKAHRRHASAQDIDGRPLFPPKLPGNYQKLWPGRVSVGAEELVKHMSNVPVYLQRVERGDNLQEKALNFGVLDWGRLEKWTDNHRRATVDQNTAESPASSNAPYLSTFGTSSQSCGRSASSYLTQRNQPPAVNHQKNSTVEEDHAPASKEDYKISNGIGCHLPEITSRRCPIRRRISGLTEKHQQMDNFVVKCAENKRKSLDSVDASVAVRSPVGSSTLPSRSKDCEISNSVNEKMKPLEFKSDCRETSRELGHVCHSISPSRSKNCETSTAVNEKMKPPEFRSNCRETSRELGHVCHSTSSSAAEDCVQDHHSGPFWLGDGMLDHFEDSIEGNQRFSSASTMNCIIPTEPGRTSFVGTLPSEDFQFAGDSPNVPHSCPLSSDIHRSGWSDVIASGSDRGKGSVSCDSVNFPQHSDTVETLRLNDWHEKHDKCASKLQENSAAEKPERWHRNETKPFTRRRDSSSNNQSYSVLIRSSSLRENSGMKQAKLASLSSQNCERETDISKSRRSPLRRLLDPLLKPKAFNLSHAAGLTAGSPRLSSHERKLPSQENLASKHGPQSFFHMTTSSSGGEAAKGFSPRSCMPMEDQCAVSVEKHDASPKQALLQLSWKNGLPLFTFSVNDSDILAATRRGVISSKEDCECIYTFYHVREVKKKIGGWINQGNKGKRKELVSNIIGQMNVSSLKCPKNHFTVREFVLFGPELKPTACETFGSVPNNELAAIVLRIPEENTESFIDSLPNSKNTGCLLKRNLETNKHARSPAGNPGSGRSGKILEKNAPKMVAILPSEVHGLSDTGKPATLVERWKSGGLCDCGGWDVGCSLTILTNNLQDRKSGCVQSCNATDGTLRVELFIQGGGQERRPVFSLVALKEGLYTVDFDTSIAVLQAFAVCLTILHGSKPRGLHEQEGSRLCKSMEGSLVKIPEGRLVDSSMSVPYHPPLSPVGRA